MDFLRSFAILLFNPVVLIVIAIVIFKNKQYKKSAYYQVTKCPYYSVHENIGRYGEYLTYKRLKHMEANGAKFLFNVYIPVGNGETSEIDVLMICHKGIFVFESKNYSGWIFGNENQKYWYQTLPAGRGKSHKEHFYNPIMQNRSHIKHLQSFLGVDVPMWSIIVFSDRCTLKSVQINNRDISVINRYSVASIVSTICDQASTDSLTENNIAEIYGKLYPYTQVDDTEKEQHIANLQNNQYDTTIQHINPIVPTPVVQSTETKEPITPAKTVSTDTVIVDSEEYAIDNKASIIVETPQKPYKCPWCNGNLVLRTATRGANAGNKFYGCSNYPKCKYIHNIANNKTV